MPTTRTANAAAPAPAAGYADSMAHLRDHLARIDLLVKAQTVRWRASIGVSKPEEHWGMIHVSDAEVRDVYLAAEFGALGSYPAEAREQIARLAQQREALEQSIATAEAHTAADVPLRLRTLQERLALGHVERDLLLVCLLPEWDPRYRRLYGYLQDDASRTQPTVELAAAILSDDGNGLAHVRPSFEESAPLLASELVLLRNRSEEPLPLRSLRLDDRIAAFLLGSDALDGRLSTLARWTEPLPWPALAAEPSHSEKLERVATWCSARPAQRSSVVLLRGGDSMGREAHARAFATTLGCALLVVDTARALAAEHPWEQTVRAVFREATLAGAALYWEGCEAALRAEQPPARLNAWLYAASAFAGPLLFGSQSTWDPSSSLPGKTVFFLELGAPGYAQRLALWSKLVPAPERFAAPAPERDALAHALGGRFQLTEQQMLDALRSAEAHALLRDGSGLLLPDDLFEGCRRQAGRRFLTFARRIEPRPHISFADLILPDANLRQLRDVRHRVRTLHRTHAELSLDQRLRLSSSMVVLFTGASGTGKTMAAECLARDLGVDLYKADLSSIVSKWVGETEKNLQQLFAEAEDTSAIIFFDEADALFGKRGEVKDARDRWANTEVNYLLQRIEDYTGVVILASNLRQNIDEAFLRRISAMVEFPAPNEAARVQIWRRMLPEAMPGPTNAELEMLASRIKVPGGSIRNIVVDATFRATAAANGEEPVITLQHLVLASAREFQKLGKPLTKAEFGDEFYRWVERDIL